MRTVGGFDAKPGTIIQVKVTGVDNDVLTFRGVLKRFVSSGGAIDAMVRVIADACGEM